MSLFKGKQVSSPDPADIAQSAQYNEIDSDEDDFYIYLRLNTVGIFQFGKTTSLRGQFKFKVKSLSFGLGTHMSQFYIKYHEIENLEIGESKTIWIPRIGLSIALGLDLEFQVMSEQYIQTPYETNSFGVSFEVLSSVTIIRQY